MSRFLHLRLAVAVIGLIVWGYGVAREDANARLVGIAVLAVSLVLRFAPKRFQQDKDEGV